MSRIILERCLEKAYPTPITYKKWMAVNSTLYLGIESRHAHWLRSLVSFDGHYSFCEFEVFSAEAVREACQEAGILFQQVWEGEIWTQTLSEKLIREEIGFVVEFIYEKPITREIWKSRQENNQFCFKEQGIKKRFTWMSLDHKRSICCFQANNAEDIRTALRKVEMPFRKIYKAYLISNPNLP